MSDWRSRAKPIGEASAEESDWRSRAKPVAKDDTVEAMKAAPPQVGRGEALVRGLGDPFGWGAEISGALQAAPRVLDPWNPMWPVKKAAEMSVGRKVADDPGTVTENYRKYRDATDKDNRVIGGARPGWYAGGQALSSIPAALAAPGQGAAGFLSAAGLGGLQGLGESRADLTIPEPEQLQQAGWDMAKGAGANAALYGVGAALQKGGSMAADAASNIYRGVSRKAIDAERGVVSRAMQEASGATADVNRMGSVVEDAMTASPKIDPAWGRGLDPAQRQALIGQKSWQNAAAKSGLADAEAKAVAARGAFHDTLANTGQRVESNIQRQLTKPGTGVGKAVAGEVRDAAMGAALGHNISPIKGTLVGAAMGMATGANKLIGSMSLQNQIRAYNLLRKAGHGLAFAAKKLGIPLEQAMALEFED